MKKETKTVELKKQNVVMERDSEYESLLQSVGDALSRGRQKVASYIGAQTVRTYWEIGKYIVEYEQNGHEKAEYGSSTLKKLSRDLSERYGSGFSMSNINKMRKLYIEYPILQTVSAKLTWSHYVELLKISDPLERSFYEKQAENENWGVRELKRQRNSMLFQRLALSTDKESVVKLAQEGRIIEKPEDILKEPFVFEFTGLPQLPTYSEGDLEEELINNLSLFFLELGKGFTFVGNQYRFNIAGRTYKIDLVFYNRILKCFVLIDLKKGAVHHEDIGQMNFYLNYCREEMNTEGDTEPIGIVLGTDQDKLVMKYALQNITNQLFVSRYQLYLPDKDELEAEFRRFIGTDNEAAKGNKAIRKSRKQLEQQNHKSKTVIITSGQEKDEGGLKMLAVCYPRCSTCKKAVKWLEDNGIEYTYRDIKEDNPTEKELREWHATSGLPLKRFFNTSGMLYRDMQLKDKLPSMSEDEMFKLLASDGLLVKRPIAVADGKVLVGFKEAEWEALK